jgi:hypothetical protein
MACRRHAVRFDDPEAFAALLFVGVLRIAQ